MSDTDVILHNLSRSTTEFRDSGENQQLMDDATYKTVLGALMYVIVPIVSCLGVTGNVFSIIILVKHGLHKCSNILLVSLAAADTTYLIAFTNIPNVLYELAGNGRFLYPETDSHVLYVFFLIFTCLDYIFGYGSLTLPMLITIERLVAVFMPLRFALIITPLRTWISVAGVMAYWVIYIIYTCFWYKFEYAYDPALNRTVGLIGRSELFYKDKPITDALEEIYFSIKIPPLFTLIGCMIIMIKVKLVSMKRRKLTNANTKMSSTSRTTKTLLTVCFFYIITCVVLALPTYMPKKYMSYSLTADEPSNLGNIMYTTACTFVCVNSTWNFLVYVAFNKNFRDTFRELTVKRCCGGRYARDE